MRIRALPLVIAIVGWPAASAFGQAFTNGGFDTGSLSGWNVAFTSNGQSFNQDVASFDIDGPGSLGASNAGRFAVGQLAFVPNDQEGVELTQSMNLVGGVNYTFSYNWAAWRPAGLGDNAEGGVFNFIVNGTSIGSHAAGTTGGSTPVYGLLTVNYVAPNTGAFTVGARITRPYLPSPSTGPPADLFQYVDNFTVTPVPEPMSMLILGGASALLALRRRRS